MNSSFNENYQHIKQRLLCGGNYPIAFIFRTHRSYGIERTSCLLTGKLDNFEA